MSDFVDLPTVTWALVATITLLTLWYHGPSFSAETVRSAPSILTGFGIFGTFVGIAFGLMDFDSENMEASVPAIIDGLGLAVWSSVLGIFAALSIRLRYSIMRIGFRPKTEAQPGVTVADLDNSLTVLTEELVQLRQESGKNLTELLASNQSYQDRVVQANTDAFVEALQKVMEDFNSRIDVQYGDNFKKFNEALGKLLDWQKSYSQQLDAMLESQNASVQVIEKATQSYDQMIEHSREFNLVAASLSEMLKGLEHQTKDLESYLDGLGSLVGKASEGLPALSKYIEELTEKLSVSITENNSALNRLLSQSSKEIAATVGQVSENLADSVNSSHRGLSEHVEAMTNKTQKHMEILDTAMEKELTNALQTFGYQLTALSEKFVNDYTPLTDRLREIIEIAEAKESSVQADSPQRMRSRERQA